MARNPLFEKMRRQRSAWKAKRFQKTEVNVPAPLKTFVRVRGGVNRDTAQVDPHASQSTGDPERDKQWFNYRGRARSTAAIQTKMLSAEKLDALSRFGWLNAKNNEPRFVQVEGNVNVGVRLFFDSAESEYVFIERKWKLERRSPVYHCSSEFAKRLFLSGRVVWSDWGLFDDGGTSD